ITIWGLTIMPPANASPPIAPLGSFGPDVAACVSLRTYPNRGRPSKLSKRQGGDFIRRARPEALRGDALFSGRSLPADSPGTLGIVVTRRSSGAHVAAPIPAEGAVTLE